MLTNETEMLTDKRHSARNTIRVVTAKDRYFLRDRSREEECGGFPSPECSGSVGRWCSPAKPPRARLRRQPAAIRTAAEAGKGTPPGVRGS